MKRTIEINDTLDENVESAIDSVKTELLDFLEANPDQDELPCLNNDLDYSGAIHEIIDGSVPVYTAELEDTWYLYSNELESALDRAGLYSDKDLGALDNTQKIQSAYYCYVQEQVNEWYEENAQDIFDEWVAEKTYEYRVIEEGASISKNDEVIHIIPTELLDTEGFDVLDHLIGAGIVPKNSRLEEV